MDAKHTPGPWTVDPENDADALGPDGKPVALCYYASMNGRTYNVHSVVRSDEESEANALRIVACVNACEGISTDALSGGLVPRAQLDAALTLVRRMADVWEPEGSGVPAALDRMHALRDDARALLVRYATENAEEGQG